VANLPKYLIAIDKKFFQSAFADAGLSQNDVAARLALDKSSMSLMMSGKRKMTLAEAAAIAGIIDSTIDKVLAKSGAMKPVMV
jgi:transcriptional regulator with XRE-family HTH domain